VVSKKWVAYIRGEVADAAQMRPLMGAEVELHEDVRTEERVLVVPTEDVHIVTE
jgi:hypothetical protein